MGREAMQKAYSSRLAFLFLMVWVAGSVALLFAAGAFLLLDPQLPFAIGLISARGPTAVIWAFLPAACGLAALVASVGRRRSGPYLALAYSVFWVVNLLGGLARGNWHANQAGLGSMPAQTRAVEGVTLAVMLAAFLLLAIWAIRQMAEHAGEPPVS